MRHTKSDNLFFFAEMLKFDGVVKLMAIENEYPVDCSSARPSILIKVLQPCSHRLCRRDTVLRCCDPPGARYIVFVIPIGEAKKAREDKEQRDRLARCVESLKCREPSPTLESLVWVLYLSSYGRARV
jgi:hypothetical protein